MTSAAVAAETTFNNETRLLFYALHKQATAGPCKEGKPWSWNVVESAKWQSWSQLGDMSSMDAMRLYVKTLDEEQVSWRQGFSILASTSPTAATRSCVRFHCCRSCNTHPALAG